MEDRFKFRYFYKPLKIMYEFQEKDYLYEFAEKENYVLMQCTGLKDKNNKLIYEGDIVKIHNDVTAKIIFDKGCFSFTDGVYNQACYWKKDTLEVIGNIYENPL